MEKTIGSKKIPQTDSVAELANFWDTHDLTDFEGELEEVSEPVFVRARGTSLLINLPPEDAQLLHKIAQSKGIDEAALLRQWVQEKLRLSTPLEQRSGK